MKTQVCLLKILLLTAVLGIVGSWAVAAPAKPPVGTKGPKTTTTPPSAAPAPEPKIPGFVIPRTNGTFLGLQVVDNRFVLKFYGADKKPVAADVTRASVRWVVHYKPTDERTVLNATADKMALTSPKFVRPPFQFKLYLSLLAENEGDEVESYVIDFLQ